MCPKEHRISRAHRRPGTHDHTRTKGAQGVFPVALPHDALVEPTPVDDHVRMELLEDHQLELWKPLLLVVEERVGLEDDVAEVRGHQQRVSAVVHRPQLVEVVTEHTGWHTFLVVWNGVERGEGEGLLLLTVYDVIGEG